MAAQEMRAKRLQGLSPLLAAKQLEQARELPLSLR